MMINIVENLLLNDVFFNLKYEVAAACCDFFIM